MTPLATVSTHIMSVGVLLLGLATLGLIYLIVFKKRLSKGEKQMEKFVAEHSLWLGFLAALLSVLGSLFYSNVIGFAACELCLIQRIFLYPQAILFAIALCKHKGSKEIANYILGLSIPGALIAGYHYYGQMFNTGALPCSASAVSCAQRPFVEFGYITIPMMSFTVFAFLISLMVIRKRNS